jgi:large subunit ribosomal protein L15
MQIQELKPIHKRKKRKRVGRGGKRGTYSGRGTKGQKARAGRRLKPIIRELIKRYPKLRGYRFKSTPTRKICVGVNLEVLEKHFKAGEQVTPKILLERKIIRRIKGRLPRVKILGRGKFSKSLTVENCLVSKKAKEIIEAARGSVKTHGVVK